MYHYNRGCIGHECIPFANCLGSLVPWSVAGASLKVWPRFFTSVDESGKGLREALASKWTSYIVLVSGIFFVEFYITPVASQPELPLLSTPLQFEYSTMFELIPLLFPFNSFYSCLSAFAIFGNLFHNSHYPASPSVGDSTQRSSSRAVQLDLSISHPSHG